MVTVRDTSQPVCSRQCDVECWCAYRPHHHHHHVIHLPPSADNLPLSADNLSPTTRYLPPSADNLPSSTRPVLPSAATYHHLQASTTIYTPLPPSTRPYHHLHTPPGFAGEDLSVISPPRPASPNHPHSRVHPPAGGTPTQQQQAPTGATGSTGDVPKDLEGRCTELLRTPGNQCQSRSSGSHRMPRLSQSSPCLSLLFLHLLLLLFLLVIPGGVQGLESEEDFSSSFPHNQEELQDEDERVMVCYYGSWAVYRPGEGKFDVEDIDPNLCTHLVYGFAGLRASNLTIVSLDPYNDLYENYGKGAYKRFTRLKEINPDLKTLLAIGGWNEGSTKYSQMVSTASGRTTFITSCVQFLQKYGFDGLDIDWEYPTLRGGRPEDKANYALLLDEMRSEFNKHDLLMTSAVSAGKVTIDAAYDVAALARNLDLVHLMGYDLHGSWERYAHHHSPLYAHPLDKGSNALLNVDWAVRYWLKLGLPPHKLVLGMPLYGRCFTLARAEEHNVYSPAPQPGLPGPYTREPGTLGYNEICEEMQRDKWSVVREKHMVSPYAYHDRQWCGYDDVKSLTVKALYVKTMGLAGAMVWSIETDDFHGSCHEQVGSFPLITTIRTILRDGRPIPTPTPEPIPTPTEPPTTTTPAPTPAPTPGPTPAPTAVCHREGLNADPAGDCTVFYDCHQVDGEWQDWLFHCAPGTVFVEDLQACDFPENHPACPLLPPVTTLPDTTLPPTTPPDTTLPPTTPPDTTLPPTTPPDTTLPPTTPPPDTTLPPTTPPDTTLPPTTPPDTTPPPTTLPDTILPPTTLPPTAPPDTTLPPTTLPDTTLPPATSQIQATTAKGEQNTATRPRVTTDHTEEEEDPSLAYKHSRKKAKLTALAKKDAKKLKRKQKWMNAYKFMKERKTHDLLMKKAERMKGKFNVTGEKNKLGVS